MRPDSMPSAGRRNRPFTAAAVATALLAGSGAAAAEPFLGAGYGQTTYPDDVFIQDVCVECVIDDSDTGFRVFAGYRFNEYVAVEGAYVSYGEVSGSLPDLIDVSAEFQGLTLAVVPSIPLGKTVSVFGKIGGVAWYGDLQATSPLVNETADGDGAGGSLLFGGGVTVNLGQNAAVSLGWERFNINDTLEIEDVDVDVDMDVDQISANFEYRFR
jgi:OOP family OmpA-OmpF porin